MFPALPSGNNPYASAAVGYAGASAGVMNALNAAVSQKATQDALDERQKKAQDVTAARQGVTDQQEYAKETQGLRDHGYLPMTVTSPGKRSPDGVPDEDTGKQVSNPAVDQNGDFHTDSKGNSWAPPKKQTVRLSKDQADEANKAGLTNIQPDTDYDPSLMSTLNASIGDWHKRNDPPSETFRPIAGYQRDGQPVNMLVGDRGTLKEASLPQAGAAPPVTAPTRASILAQSIFGGGDAQAPATSQATDPQGRPYWGQNQGGAQPAPATVQPPQPGAAPAAPTGAAPSAFAQPQTEDEAAQGAYGANPNGPFAAQPPQAPAKSGFTFAPAKPKPGTRSILSNQVGPNGGPLVLDHDTQTITEAPPIPGSRQTMTLAQTEADKDRHVQQERTAEDRAARLSAADQVKADKATKAADLVGAKHQTFQDREQDQWDLNKRFQDLANPTVNPNGTNVVLPNYNEKTGEITEGPIRTMSDQLRGQMLAQSAQAQRKAAEHAASAKALRKSMGWGEFAPAQAAPATTAAKPKTPAAQPVQPAAAPPPAKAAPARKILMKAPTGELLPVPADQVAHYRKKGAVVVTAQ